MCDAARVNVRSHCDAERSFSVEMDNERRLMRLVVLARLATVRRLGNTYIVMTTSRVNS